MISGRQLIEMPDEPEARLRRYEERLNDGYELIEKRRAAGMDVTKLEDFWIQLLHEYEEECDAQHKERKQPGRAEPTQRTTDKPWRKPVPAVAYPYRGRRTDDSV